MPSPLPIPVCVLAHNEERHIAGTLAALQGALERQPEGEPQLRLHVYANGCTDGTVAICQELARRDPRIEVHELAVASKANAWNEAFRGQDAELLVFADGDVRPEPGAVATLVAALRSDPRLVVASSRQLPASEGLRLEQAIVGFLQLPLDQDYLYGGLYAVRREALRAILARYGFSGLPRGITGDDCFLELLLGEGQLAVAACRTYYIPPTFQDYFRYLARVRWQNEQLHLLVKSPARSVHPGGKALLRKLARASRRGYLFRSLPAVALRTVFKKVYAARVNAIYQALGPVSERGEGVLSSLTRSHSTK